MLKSEAAAYLAGVTQTEGAEASAPTNLHVITGEVGEASADGKTLVKIDGLMFSESDDQFIEVDALGGLEEGDIATIVLTGEQGHAMTPLALGSIGSVDRITVRIAAIEADYIKVEQLDAAKARIGELEADHVSVDDFNAATGRIGTLETTRATITDLNAATARIGDLEADHVSTDDLSAATARIGTLETYTADIGTIRANSAKVQNLTAAELEADHATVGSLSTNYAHITNGVIDNATIGYADVNNLSAHYAEIQNGKIDSALINTAAIVDEQVFTVTGNKATISQLNADHINVRSINVKDLTVETANGYVNVGGKQTPTKELLDSIKDELQQEIDGAVETFTSSAVPLLNNYPASEWIISGATAEEQRKAYAKHVGDICYVQNSALDQNGYAYRFAYDSTEQTFKWVLIKDSDVTKALGDISDLKTFESDTTTWMEETDEGLTTIRQNHTALSGVVDKTVVETKQLWFTKSNTTAPNKPTAQVTSTSTAGNAWRVVVPAYNASYPNYYYCLQYKLADGTYAWSDVVRDIAMGESQQQGRQGVADAATADGKAVAAQTTADGAATAAATADGKAVSAQTTANANIKSSVQLWFTKANTTAPNKPTAQVTVNDAAKTNQWNLAIPTYNSSYPNYFYCYQQQKGDGTWQWTDVVYDRSITEAQAKAQSALPSSEFNTFKTTTFKEVVDEVGEHSTSISTLSDTVSTKADQSTVTTLSNTVNTVKQTADTNKASITNLTQTVNNKADGSTVTTLTNRVSTVEQNLSGITTRVGKTESELDTVSNPNLTPWFGMEPYSTDAGYWERIVDTEITGLGDGWAHISKSNTGSSTAFVNYFITSNGIPKDLKPSTNYTFLVEKRNVVRNTSVSGYTLVITGDFQTEIDVFSSSVIGNFDEGAQYLQRTTAPDLSVATKFTRGYISVPAGSSIEMDIRISLYEGEYSGPYKPYVDQTLSNRVKSAETSIEQNSEAIALRATKADVQSLGGNLLTDTDNPVLGSSSIAPKYSVVSGGNGTGTIATVTDSPLPNFNKAFRITGNTSGNRDFAQIVGIVYGQNYLFTAYVRGIGGEARALIRVFSGSELFTYSIVVGTDWTPIRTIVTLTGAGSAAYYFFQFGLTGAGSIEYIAPCLSGGAAANSAAELKVANDNINLKVSKNDVINQINVSTEGAKIQASRVEIDGTAVFNAAKSKLDAAYDAKGAAATVQNNLDSNTRSCLVGQSGSTKTNPWYKVASTTITTQYVDAIAVFDVFNSGGFGAVNRSGRLTVHIRASGGVNSVELPAATWESRGAGVVLSDFVLAYKLTAGSKIDAELWCHCPYAFTGYLFKVVYEGNRTTVVPNTWTLYNTWTTGSQSAITSGYTQVVSTDANAAQAVADAAAPKASAVKRTQRIWYRTNASGAPATPGTASSNWVTKADDGNDEWTKMHIAISSTHKYIYTCEQYEMANGTVGYTSVLLDNTITVIDGGNIITGTVTANKLNAANINASKTLTIGAMTDAAASSILNSNVVVGGRNLYIFANASAGYIRSSEPLGDVVLTPTQPQHSTSDFIPVSPGDVYTLQMWNPNLISNTSNSNRCVCWYDSNKSYISIQGGSGDANGSRPNGKAHWSFTLDPAPSNAAYARFGFIIGPSTNVVDSDIRVKVEKGNKPTDWTPAPEDQTAYVDAVQVGGRNLFALSQTLDTSKWTYENGATRGDNLANLAANASSRVYQMPAKGYWSWEANTEYVVSVEAKASASGGKITFNMVGAGSGVQTTVDITTEWQRYSWAFVSGATVSTGSASIYNSTTTGTVQVRKPQLEKGNKATDWTPAPEDMATNSSVDQTYVQNLTPYFLTDMTQASDEYWANLTYARFSRLGDGWAHFEYANSGSSTVNNFIKPKLLDFLEPGGKYTLLIEFKNVSISKDGGSFYSQQGSDLQVWGDSSYCGFSIPNATIRALSGGAGTFYRTLTLLTADSKDPSGTVRGSLPKTSFMSINSQVAAGQTVSYDLRLSLYEDGYTGPYKPYSGDQLYATNSALAGTNESLEGAITDIGELSDQLVGTVSEQNKTITDIQKYLNSLRQDLDAEIQSRQQWLNFNAAEGLVIGAKNSTFKTVTTNTSQQFKNGGTVLAETSGMEFVAPVMRSDQILIGNWMWTRRDNGNLSLKWIG